MITSNAIRIVYMGTPEFAVPALDALDASNHQLVGVVTQPDRARGRGHKMVPSPVKKRATELGLTVCEPESLRDGGVLKDYLIKTSPDLIVVCAYGKILPKDTLDFPRLGCVNIHASLLPKYRGAAPIHRAIENGETETGITLMRMSEGLDEGDIIAFRTMQIEGMDTGEATRLLSKVGAELLMDTLATIADGSATAEPQDESVATYASPVAKEEGHIDFTAAPGAVRQRILAMTPTPGAYAHLSGEKVKLSCARVIAGSDAGAARCPGEVLGTDGGEIVVSTGYGSIGIARIQAPGGKMMDVSDYLRGHPLGAGVRFE